MKNNPTAPPTKSSTQTISGELFQKCPVCTSTSSELRFRLQQYEIRKCTECDCEFNASFRGGGGSGGTFDKDYYLVTQKAAFSHGQDYQQDPSIKVFEKHLAQVERQVGKKGRLLDIGPGLGTFVRTAKERGWTPQAVEISKYAAEHIRNVHAIDVFCGGLDKFECPDESFDLVTFWDSIEHVDKPKQNLEKAFKLLRSKGLVVVTTDNFDCLVANIAKYAYKFSFGSIKYPVRRLYIEPNFLYFTEKTLRNLIQKIGFREIRFQKMEYPIEKINLKKIERVALRLIYWVASLTNRQAQMTLVAQKP